MYDNFLREDNPSDSKSQTTNNTSKVNEYQNISYEIKSSDVIGKVISNGEGSLDDLLDDNNIRYYYPVITEVNEDIKELNKTIKDNVNSLTQPTSNIANFESDLYYKIILSVRMKPKHFRILTIIDMLFQIMKKVLKLMNILYHLQDVQQVMCF